MSNTRFKTLVDDSKSLFTGLLYTNAPNYSVGATLSGYMFLVSLVAKIDGDAAFWLGLAGAAGGTALAGYQYGGLAKTYQTVSSYAGGLFSGKPKEKQKTDTREEQRPVFQQQAPGVAETVVATTAALEAARDDEKEFHSSEDESGLRYRPGK